jgi:hypothetical protein
MRRFGSSGTFFLEKILPMVEGGVGCRGCVCAEGREFSVPMEGSVPQCTRTNRTVDLWIMGLH